MYTTYKTELGRLKAYEDELAERYRMALGQRDFERARRIFDLRRRVQRTIRLSEEFGSVETALRIGSTLTPTPTEQDMPAVLREALKVVAAAGW
jgi:hypothetical protein